MNVNMKKNNFLINIFYIALFLLPYDAIKYTMPSVYKPISVYVMFIFLILYVMIYSKLCWDKATKLLLAFALYGIVFSLIVTVGVYNNISNYVEFVVTLLLGVICFLASNIGFKVLAKTQKPEEYIYNFFNMVCKIYMIPIFVGLLEVLSIVGILPHGIRVITKTIFGGDLQIDRVTMTTFEASWASMHILFAFFPYCYCFLKEKSFIKLICIIILSILFLMTFSLQGILCLGIGIGVFLCVNIILKNGFKGVITLLWVAFLGIGCIILFINLLDFLSKTGKVSVYGLGRIQSIVEYILEGDYRKILFIDGSAFVRIGYLIINLMVFFNTYLVGVGGGNFISICPEYVKEYFPEILTYGRIYKESYGEVYEHVISGNCNSAISIYFRVLSELGIVGGILFFSFMKEIIKQVKLLSGLKYNKIILLWFCVVLALVIQFASYAYVPFWVTLAFVYNIEKCRDG